jgi:hypothetical protein
MTGGILYPIQWPNTCDCTWIQSEWGIYKRFPIWWRVRLRLRLPYSFYSYRYSVQVRVSQFENFKIWDRAFPSYSTVLVPYSILIWDTCRRQANPMFKYYGAQTHRPIAHTNRMSFISFHVLRTTTWLRVPVQEYNIPKIRSKWRVWETVSH